MTRDQADLLLPGDGIIVSFGRQGSQYAHVVRQASGALGGVIVRKWQRNRRRWTGEVRVNPSEISETLPTDLTRQAFYVDGQTPP